MVTPLKPLKIEQLELLCRNTGVTLSLADDSSNSGFTWDFRWKLLYLIWVLQFLGRWRLCAPQNRTED